MNKYIVEERISKDLYEYKGCVAKNGVTHKQAEKARKDLEETIKESLKVQIIDEFIKRISKIDIPIKKQQDLSKKEQIYYAVFQLEMPKFEEDKDE